VYSSGYRSPVVVGATAAQTSITHHEYLRAVQRKLPVMALLLDEHYPWLPQFIGGFDTSRAVVSSSSDATGKVEERFARRLSTSAVLSTLCPKVPGLGIFAEWLQKRPVEYRLSQ